MPHKPHSTNYIFARILYNLFHEYILFSDAIFPTMNFGCLKFKQYTTFLAVVYTSIVCVRLTLQGLKSKLCDNLVFSALTKSCVHTSSSGMSRSRINLQTVYMFMYAKARSKFIHTHTTYCNSYCCVQELKISGENKFCPRGFEIKFFPCSGECCVVSFFYFQSS